MRVFRGTLVAAPEKHCSHDKDDFQKSFNEGERTPSEEHRWAAHVLLRPPSGMSS